MKLTPEQIQKEIAALIDEGKIILNTKWSPGDYGVISVNTYVSFEKYTPWWSKARNFLGLFLSTENTFLTQFDSLQENHLSNASACIGILESVNEQVSKGFVNSELRPEDVSEVLDNVFTRFHKVARQLRTRHSNRATIEVNDEYDVQDLLHAVLLLFFDDVRKEEWTPSYAGGSSRQDFLLKTEKIVIETKKTRESMRDKDLGEELIIDIDRYKAHPDCDRLICFVYDPEGRLGNPQGIMNDLNKQHEGFAKVIIRPN